MHNAKNNPRGTTLQQRELYRVRLLVERVEERRHCVNASWQETDCEQWGDNNFVLSCSADAEGTKMFVDQLVSTADNSRDSIGDIFNDVFNVPVQIDDEDQPLTDAGRAILAYLRMRQEESLPEATLPKMWSFFTGMVQATVTGELNRLMELDLVRSVGNPSTYFLTREGYRAAIRHEEKQP